MLTTQNCSNSWNGIPDLRPIVVGYLRRHLRDDAEIEDTAQEALLRAARYRLHLVDAARLRPWVLRIALNVLRDRRRRERKIPRTHVDDEHFEAVEGREAIPGEALEDGWIDLSGVTVERSAAFGHLERALEELGVRERDLVERWSSGPAASAGASAVCDAPRSRALKHRLFRARRRLTRAVLQRFAMDPALGWPQQCGEDVERRLAAGAPCARAGRAEVACEGVSAPRRNR